MSHLSVGSKQRNVLSHTDGIGRQTAQAVEHKLRHALRRQISHRIGIDVDRPETLGASGIEELQGEERIPSCGIVTGANECPLGPGLESVACQLRDCAVGPRPGPYLAS